jgi:nucleoside-diphosphate-sugar epimerase
MKVLITGSTGWIGRWIVQRLLEAGHLVRTLDIPAQAGPGAWEHIPGDVRDLPVVRRAVQGMQAIVHLAAIPYDVERQDELILDTNLRGTWNVLLAAQEAGVERVVNFSSINALGQGEPSHPNLYLPLDDDIPHHNVRNYSLSKHLGEELCTAFAARGNYSVISLRPTAVIFPGPPRFPWFASMTEEFKIRTGIADFFSYVDVRDVTEATLLSLTVKMEGHQAFLLTANDNSLNKPSTELVGKYYAHLPWPKVSKEEYFSNCETISLVDCSAAKHVLGWQPRYSQFDPQAGYNSQA